MRKGHCCWTSWNSHVSDASTHSSHRPAWVRIADPAAKHTCLSTASRANIEWLLQCFQADLARPLRSKPILAHKAAADACAEGTKVGIGGWPPRGPCQGLYVTLPGGLRHSARLNAMYPSRNDAAHAQTAPARRSPGQKKTPQAELAARDVSSGWTGSPTPRSYLLLVELVPFLGMHVEEGVDGKRLKFLR